MVEAPRRIVGVPWFEADTYQRVRAIMDDPENLMASHKDFLEGALGAVRSMTRARTVVVRVVLDEVEFPAFCQREGLRRDAVGRMAYAAQKAKAAHDRSA